MMKVNFFAQQQTGQVAIVLLLLALVALTIGLAVTQRSLTNVTTSSQTEQVSRAFSAAEAGLERSLNQVAVLDPRPAPNSLNIPLNNFNNQSQARVDVVTNLPSSDGQALEYPPIGKDTFSQFWLVDSSSLSAGANLTAVNIYFGRLPLDEPGNQPALELNIISRQPTGVIYSARRYYDPVTTRIVNNGFTPIVCPPQGFQIYTSNSQAASVVSDTLFYCRVNLVFALLAPDIPVNAVPIMIRARILYSNIKQPIAVQPQTCAQPTCFLPRQAAIYSSIGTAGQSQKTIQIFRQINYLPSFLDYAIFSSGAINKN